MSPATTPIERIRAIGPTARVLVTAAAGAVLVPITALSFTDPTLDQLSLWLIQGLLALSLVLVWGRGGIFSLGQTALFGVGGYAFGATAINLQHQAFFVPGLIVAALTSAVLAAVVGYFVCYGRVSALNVAILTLAATLIGYSVLNSLADPKYRIGHAVLGGFDGMVGIPLLRLGGEDSALLTKQHAFVLFGLVAVVLALLVALLLRSPFGRVSQAIRVNEQRADLLGFDVRRYRLQLFVIGGALAGLAGGLFAAWGSFVNPDQFSLQPAILVIIWVLVGGRASVLGAFLGVFTVEGLTSWLGGEQGQYSPLYLGASLIVVVLLAPGGLIALGALAGRLAQRRRATSEIVSQGSTGHVIDPETLPETPPANLAVAGVRRTFAGAVAVDRVDLDLESRGIRCIIGPNGAGKSTLFAMLVGTLRPSSGSVHLDGSAVTRLPAFRRVRRGLGIKLQAASVFEEMTVRENLWLAAYSATHRRGAADRETAALLQTFALSERAGELASVLSHGEQQWLEIAMVLARHPSVVLLDEPTAGMTTEETEQMAHLVRALARRASVVVIEHDMAFIRQLDAPVTVLHLGRELISGSMAELENAPEVREVYLGSYRSEHAAT